MSKGTVYSSDLVNNKKGVKMNAIQSAEAGHFKRS